MVKNTDDNRLAKIKNYVKKIGDTVKNLEINLNESNQGDHEVLMAHQVDRIKYQGLSNQLEEAQKENKELLNILQQKCSDTDLSRPNSQLDVSPSCSTMSIVHLQYKYEELLVSYRGLLKLLDLKSNEIKKVHDENCVLKEEVKRIEDSLSRVLHKNGKIKKKVSTIKSKKNAKIQHLKTQNETLRMAHDQLASLLHNRCMEKDEFLSNEIKNCNNPEKALLLQEIRKNNLLTYENFQLNQEIQHWRNIIQDDKLTSSKEKV